MDTGAEDVLLFTTLLIYCIRVDPNTERFKRTPIKFYFNTDTQFANPFYQATKRHLNN